MNQPVAYDAERAQRVHLSHLLNHTSSPCLESFSASFVEPCAYWSHVEKASFFESLARHSRWKPDLIAEDIGGGKTIADVCSYISLLEQGSARESRRKRDAFPAAHELSEDWMALENSVAEGLCGKEAEWQEAALKHKRAQELKEVKNSLRRGSEIVKGSGSERDDTFTTPQTTKRKRQASNQENEVWEDRFKARKRELRDLWKREDMLSSLDGRFLKTMDQMLRILETTEEDKAIEEGRLELENTGRDKRVQLRNSASFNFPCDVDTPSAIQPSDLVSNVNEADLQLHPFLLAIDGTIANAQMLSLHPSDKRRDPIASSSMSLQSAVPLPSHVHTPRQSGVEESERDFQPLRAQSSVIDPVLQTPQPSPIPVAEIPSDLSPASRRRLRKRLWTRRKRAMESGLPVSEVPMDITKLKRGRKPKRKVLGEGVKTKEDDSDSQVEVNFPGALYALSHSPTTQGHSGVRDDAVDKAEDEDEEPESAPKRKPYGWGKLKARQVSGETLRADGLDLFHLEKFVSMMSLLGHVHALSNEADSINGLQGSSEGPPTLSYSLLRLLRACVTRFVTCLIAYAVLHKDVETRQKRRIRGIFRTGRADEVRAENIREALLHMDKDTTTKHFFMRLKRTVKKAAATQVPSGDGTGSEFRGTGDSDEAGSSDDGSITGETEGDASSSTGSFSNQFNRILQKVFPPPYDDHQSASPLFWNPSVLSAIGDKEGDSILPDEIDEAGLWKELRAEEKLDGADREAAHIHERELWTEIGVARVEQHDSVMKVGSRQTNILLQKPEGTEALRHLNTRTGLSQSLRFRPPGGTVKSRVYIDSDEDA